MILLNHILLIVTLVTIITSGIIGAYLLSKNPPYKILGFISAISFFWTGLSFLLLSKVFSIDPLILLELQSLILSAASILWLDFSLLYSILKKQWYNFGFKFSYLALVFIAISLLVYNFERGLTQEAVQIIKIAWMLSSVFQLAILATSIYLLRKTSLNRPNHNKYQFKALIIAVTLPFIAILIYLLQGFDAFINKDYYSLSVVFTLSNISLFVALFRSSLVEHLPNTYQSLFSSNKNLIILLDRQANIMNYNPAAKLFLEKLSISPINQNIYKLIPNLPSKEEHFKDIAVNIFEVLFFRR